MFTLLVSSLIVIGKVAGSALLLYFASSFVNGMDKTTKMMMVGIIAIIGTLCVFGFNLIIAATH